MDDKHRQQLHSKHRWSRYRDVESYRRTISRFLHTQKQSLLTSFLLVVIVALLFGIFSQFQPPPKTIAPAGVRMIEYSTFVQQVKARNVLAVIMLGNEIHGLLATPLSQKGYTPNTSQAARPSHAYDTDILTWKHYVSVRYAHFSPYTPASSRSKTPSSPSIDSRRFIYTQLPGSGDANLMPLLLNNHVLVNTLPYAQPPAWFVQLLRYIPLVFLVFVLLLTLASSTSGRSNGYLDERVSRIAKKRARLVVHVQEAGASRPATKKSAAAITTKEVRAAKKEHSSMDPPVTFADVAGIDEVRVELEEVVQFLRSPERFHRLGARIPRGALLVGPPGTGKTLLARAVAGEAGVPFFNMSASEFVEMYVGVGASRVRDLFKQARQSAPCVIFLDELDAVGRKRSMSMMGNDERDQTLNQLLVELDGFDPRQAVVVLAATNRADILDQALLRPGRFDRHITVSLPDRPGREAILRVHTRRTPLHEDVSLAHVSRLSTGMSGADLANLVNEAALSAARQELTCLTNACFEEALARVQLGALRPLVMSEADRRIIAFHEGGHALVAYHLPQADAVNRVTILPRGQTLGVTQFTVAEDRYNYSRETLLARIAVGLAGRVAEELTFGLEGVTTGAENDLQAVTDLARRMVTRWGMSEQVGVVFADYEHGAMKLAMRRLDPGALPAQALSLRADADGLLTLNGEHRAECHFTYAVPMAAATKGSTTLAALIDIEMQRILQEGYTMARAVLSEHSDQLTKLANALMEHEQLDRSQFEALFQQEQCSGKVFSCLPMTT